MRKSRPPPLLGDTFPPLRGAPPPPNHQGGNLKQRSFKVGNLHPSSKIRGGGPRNSYQCCIFRTHIELSNALTELCDFRVVSGNKKRYILPRKFVIIRPVSIFSIKKHLAVSRACSTLRDIFWLFYNRQKIAVPRVKIFPLEIPLLSEKHFVV